MYKRQDDTLASDIEHLEQSFANSSHTKINDPVKMYLKEIGRVELLDPKEMCIRDRCYTAVWQR